jgi:long-chain acyl-CoA synthetase
MNSNYRQRSAIATDLFEAFREASLEHAHRVALKGSGGQGKIYTYGETESFARRLSVYLRTGRLAPHREIGILAENRPEWPIAYMAILAAGKTVVPIDSNLKPEEIEYVLNQSGAGIVFVSGRFEPVLAQIRPDLHIISLESASPRSWEKIGDLSQGVPEEQTENAVAALIFTSGTTGNPRAVVLTHGNLLANLEGIRPALSFGSSDVFLSVLPLHHTYEATCGFLAPLTSGATVVYARSLKSKEILADIAANRVTVMACVPLLYEKMYHSIQRGIQGAPLLRRLLFRALYALSSLGWKLGAKWGRWLFRAFREKIGLGSVRLFVSGGAPIPAEIARFFNFIGVDFLQGYGMTECSPVISTNRPDNIKFGSVGPALSNLEVRIDNPNESGVGEIIVKGPSTTPGYRDNPKKTQELIRDGWLHTGDLGCLKGGHLWITGRSKNVIVSAAGKNIYPEEIEEKLSESPYILEAVVFGRKKEGKQGEEVRAIIVPDTEQFRADFGMLIDSPDADLIKKILDEQVAELCGRMADFKRISGFSVQMQELEKTSSKKVKRFMYNQGDRQTTEGMNDC